MRRAAPEGRTTQLRYEDTEHYAVTRAFLQNPGKMLRDIFAGIDGDQVPGAIEALVAVYKRERQGSETFIDTVKRAGLEPFKEGFTAYVARETAGEPA